MLRVRLSVLFFVLFGLVGGPVIAAEGVKIGVIDFQKALNSVEQGKRAKDQLKGEFDSKQKKLDLQQNELKQIREDFEKQKLALSEAAVREKEKQFNDKYMELQKNIGGYRQDLATKEAKMTGLIIQNLRQIVGEIGKQEKFTLVVEKSQDAVVYAESQDDLTDRVISIYNKKFTGNLNIQ